LYFYPLPTGRQAAKAGILDPLYWILSRSTRPGSHILLKLNTAVDKIQKLQNGKIPDDPPAGGRDKYKA